MTESTITPNEAATRLGIARSSVMRAIKSGRLQGFRDNHGRWLIPEDELKSMTDDRAVTQPVSDRSPDLGTQSVTQASSVDTPEALIRLAAAESERDQLRERLDEMRNDRDEWRRIADKLAEQREKKRRWWLW